MIRQSRGVEADIDDANPEVTMKRTRDSEKLTISSAYRSKRWLGLVALQALLFAVVLPVVAFDWEAVVGGDSGILNGFGWNLNKSIDSMALFGGQLYGGTNLIDADWGCEVRRTADGSYWSLCNWPGFGNHSTAPAMAVFNSLLYVGIAYGSAGCEVHRSVNGTTWDQVVAGGFDGIDNSSVAALATFGNRIYAGTSNIAGCEVWRSDDGVAWAPVVGGTAVVDNGFGATKNYKATSMAVFNGRLYAGTSVTDPDPGLPERACEIWRSADGVAWSRVNVPGFGDWSNSGATAFAVFRGNLYVGTFKAAGSCEVWRSANGTTWNQVNSDGFGDPGNTAVSSMVVHGGYLYLGTSNHTTGCETWRTPDGDSWGQVNTDGFGDAGNTIADSLHNFGKHLYVGTTNNEGLEIWRLLDSNLFWDGFETGDTSMWSATVP
jgi:hypothetical protein